MTTPFHKKSFLSCRVSFEKPGDPIATTFSSICSALLAPIQTEVTRGSFKSQAMLQPRTSAAVIYQIFITVAIYLILHIRPLFPWNEIAYHSFYGSRFQFTIILFCFT